MLKEKLKSYRAERRAFIESLKYHFDMDFYELDPEERKCWLACYMDNKREFFKNLQEHLQEEFREFKHSSNFKRESMKND